MRRLLTYSLFFLLPLALHGQVMRKDIPDHPFLQLGKNEIHFPADSSGFDLVFRKLDSILFLGSGDLNILIIGDSHTQGGTFVKEVRNNLVSLRPLSDGGFGLVFPFSAAKTNNPNGYVTKYTGAWTAARNTMREPPRRLGLTGMSLTTSDGTASVTIRSRGRKARETDPRYLFDTVKVLGYHDGGNRVPVVLHGDGDTLAGVPSRGDSCWTFVLPSLADSVKVATKGNKGEFTLTGIYLDNPFHGITVSGTGVNGASLPSYARCKDLERDLEVVSPDLVIFEIGVNDAVAYSFDTDLFEARYKALVRRVRSVNPDCAILFITNNDTFRYARKRRYHVNTNGALARDAFFRIAGENGGAVWDFYGIMGGSGSMREWEKAGLARRDKIHFTDEGYELQGDLFFNALMDKFSEYMGRKGNE